MENEERLNTSPPSPARWAKHFVTIASKFAGGKVIFYLTFRTTCTDGSVGWMRASEKEDREQNANGGPETAEQHRWNVMCAEMAARATIATCFSILVYRRLWEPSPLLLASKTNEKPWHYSVASVRLVFTFGTWLLFEHASIARAILSANGWL